MLFFVSSAMKFHAKPVAETAIRTTPRLNTRTRALTQELRQLEAKDIKKQLHVNDALAKEYAKHLLNFESKQPAPCCTLFDDRLFAGLDAHNWEEDEARWANSQLRIFSGLYGLLRPFDEIQQLSLPVRIGTKLTNSKGKFLRDFWREALNRQIADDLQKIGMPVIVNMSADEDSAEFLNYDVLPEGTRVATVDFKTSDRDDANEAKGEFLRWALETRCTTVEELLDFKGVGVGPDDEAGEYRLNPKESSEDKLMFEEATQGGGWRQKLAESGGSKKKFMSEFAGGKKNAYMRTEINKAMIKESKKGRKKSSVC